MCPTAATLQVVVTAGDKSYKASQLPQLFRDIGQSQLVGLAPL
jgi:hypothetical protein